MNGPQVLDLYDEVIRWCRCVASAGFIAHITISAGDIERIEAWAGVDHANNYLYKGLHVHADGCA